MRTNILEAILSIFLYSDAVSAYERQCDAVYGHPKYDDCMVAARRIPATFKPIFIGPEAVPAGTIATPFVVSNGNCEIRIQSSARVRTKWLVMQNLAAVLVNGVPGADALIASGCVKSLGIGGVVTAKYSNDPLWVEVKEKGVPGPPQGGSVAPLLKGLGGEHVLVPANAPLPPGWYPESASGSTSEQQADVKKEDKKSGTS